MRTKKLLSAFAIVLFAFSVAAQDKPGTVAALEFQKPKNGMVKQYEDGRKQKATWHKQQNDPQPLLVWETLSGPETGTYIVGRLGQHWADFDKPAIPDQSDLDEYQKAVGSYVESLVGRYYELMPKISNPVSPGTAPKFDEIVTFMCAMANRRTFRAPLTESTTLPRRRSGRSISNGMRWRAAVIQEPMCWFSRAPIGPLSRRSLT
jgi:hypothetical protein